ncbi:MAG: hypothetical protein EpisKO_33510 [Epibacterium sp.]
MRHTAENVLFRQKDLLIRRRGDVLRQVLARGLGHPSLRLGAMARLRQAQSKLPRPDTIARGKSDAIARVGQSGAVFMQTELKRAAARAMRPEMKKILPRH